jgi:leader peptidase (prepilin peptidase)/N-methyltransferase
MGWDYSHMRGMAYSHWIPALILPVFALGLLAGSFLNVCIDRIPRKKSIVFPGSCCDFCGRPLGWADLIPVVSYLVLKGRCRYCQTALTPRMPFVELAAGLLYVALLLRFGLQWRLLLFGVLASVLVVVSIVDLEWMIIPDEVLILGACTALGFIAAKQGPSVWDALTGALAGGGLLWLMGLFSAVVLKKEGMGGGDIKLMAMAGLYFGWRWVLLSLLFASVAGGIIAAALVVKDRANLRKEIPFGPLLSLGILCSVFFGDVILELYIQRLLG